MHACVTEKCYAAFGGRGSVARVFGQRILLSPRGLNWHFLAHEWSHAEMSTRLTLFAWKRMPSWFDEGLAVAISEAPEHSENHWQFLINTHIPRPTRDELLTYQSLQQWLDAGKSPFCFFHTPDNTLAPQLCRQFAADLGYPHPCLAPWPGEQQYSLL